jgi:hypothetical protein
MATSTLGETTTAPKQRGYRLSRRLGLLVGALHLGMVLVFALRILVLSMRPVAQWQLEWLGLEQIDWPVSQLLWWGGWPRGPYEGVPLVLRDPFWFLVPLFVFGVLGSAWYGLIGSALGFVADRVRHRRHP